MALFEREDQDFGADGTTRVSLRAKPGYDVQAVASMFGGGGHKAAAGARIPGRALSVQRRVIGAIRNALEAAKNK